MHRGMKGLGRAFLVVAAIGAVTAPRPAFAASAKEIDSGVSKALKTLYAENATAKSLGKKAKAILVFPNIVKGGLIVGGQYGEGRFAGAANQPDITAARRPPTAFRRVFRNSVTRFSS